MIIYEEDKESGYARLSKYQIKNHVYTLSLVCRIQEICGDFRKH